MKSTIFRVFKVLGLEIFYLKTLFFFKERMGTPSSGDSRLLDFYRNLLPKNTLLVFDIGANVGGRTMIFSQLSTETIAIEPNPDLVDLLRFRFRGEGVEILQNACSNRLESRTFEIGDNHLLSTLSSDFIDYKKEFGVQNKWSKSIKIDTLTLDSLVDRFGSPDFCKIDVEGFEKEVIEGLNSKIGIISFEFNAPKFLDDSIFCVKKLSSLGYTEFNLSMAESLTFEYDSWASESSLIERIVSLKESGNNCYGDIYCR